MSAICGFWVLRGDFDPQTAVSCMQTCSNPHGSQAHSVYTAEAICLGFQLLKVTIEDEVEAQPLAFPLNPGQSNSTSAVLVADARINNREQLAREFGLSPVEAARLPDSAFLLQAWQRWGHHCVHHLIGAFAFAVWDPRAQQLFLARDHAGERPLYFVKQAGTFAFATSARALLTCPGVSRDLDEGTIARDLLGLPPQPSHTRFRDVQALAPGESMLVTSDSLSSTPRRYWNLSDVPPTRYANDHDYVEAFLEIFDEAVRCRLRTAGAIASELSAGLDSGAITATAARFLAASGKKLMAFTAVPRPAFRESDQRGWIADEGPGAAEVAAIYPNIQHCLVDTTRSDILHEIGRLFELSDRPVPAPLNQVWLNLILDRAASAGANVLLNGAAGNVTISYTGRDILHRDFQSGHWLKAIRRAIQLRRNGDSSGRDMVSLTLFSALPWALRTRIDPIIRGVGLQHTAIRHDRARELNLIDEARRHFFLSNSHVPSSMELESRTNEFGDFNAATTAGWGIERRDPTTDKRVWEFCASIPLEQYVVGDQARSLIRRAMRGRLPASTLDHRERGLQAADWYASLTPIRAELSSELARIERSPIARRLFDLDVLRSAVDHWPQSAGAAAEQDAMYDSTVSSSIAVGYFIRRCEEAATQ